MTVFAGLVVDAGGGIVDILVDCDTEEYPEVDARVIMSIEEGGGVVNCSDCHNTGYLLDQGYGVADIPDGWIPVQACDNCRIYNAKSADEDAARAAAANFNVAVEWFEPDPVVVGDEFFDAGPGDWAINFPGPNLRRFRVEWYEHRHMAGYIYAESESAARQCYIDGILDAGPVEVNGRATEFIGVWEEPK